MANKQIQKLRKRRKHQLHDDILAENKGKNIIETFPETHISKIPYTYEEIVTSICLYVMKEDGRGRELRFNKDFLISIGLTRDKYEVISENLQSLPELPE